MGASCGKRRTSLNHFSSLGSFTEQDIKAAGAIQLPKVQRSLSRLGTRILLADNVGRSPEEGYDIDQKAVGVGGFGVVRLGKKKGTSRESAIKTVQKASEKSQRMLQNEVGINLEMDHPNIVKLYDVYEDDNQAHLAMELCNGGEVLEVIMQEGKFGEKDAAVLIHQLLQAVRYMHFRAVCHRDLKLENLLLLDKDVPIQQNTLKLIDFGLSKRFTPGTREMKTKAGSALYVAPEVLSTSDFYSEVCDVWSCGVILFIMLSGSPPFNGDTNAQILKQLLKDEVAFPPRKWSHVSAEARGHVEEMMQRDPTLRPTAEMALQKTWLKVSHKDEPPEHPDMFFDNLQQFSVLNSFTKAARHLVAHRVGQHEVKSLKAVFERMDTNQDGVLSLEEMLAGCEKAGILGLDDMKEVFENIDTNHSGQVDYTEFMAAALDQQLFGRHELCQEAFEVFDQDHNGEITVDELREVLENDATASRLGQDNLREILRRVDANGDQKIDFSEFVDMLKMPAA